MKVLDLEVKGSVALLNKLSGVETFSSCSGHGLDLPYITFYCSELESLETVIRAVNAVRRDCGDDFDVQVHLWQVSVIPQNGDRVEWCIDWQDRDKQNGAPIKTLQAWNALEASFKRRF